MSKQAVASPFQALETEAYHAFREWPLWLVLRDRELGAHLAPAGSPRHPSTPEDARPATQPDGKGKS
ncbi:MAG TPA: hypothetical protein PLQ56_21070 [Aggregatilineales bacterium]|nr:hypothetical protein [Aggregatilineales bacterium]